MRQPHSLAVTPALALAPARALAPPRCLTPCLVALAPGARVAAVAPLVHGGLAAGLHPAPVLTARVETRTGLAVRLVEQGPPDPPVLLLPPQAPMALMTLVPHGLRCLRDDPVIPLTRLTDTRCPLRLGPTIPPRVSTTYPHGCERLTAGDLADPPRARCRPARSASPSRRA